MRRNLTKGLQLILGVVVTATALPRLPAVNAWTLVWADEFQQADGSAPDPAKWIYDLGGNGWGNNELQTYTRRTNNVRIEGGQLVIEARQESFTGTDGLPRNYTSARLKTQGQIAWTYGRIEARIQVPRGQGLWPAFWMLGTNVTGVGWPTCGEIDIFENIGAEPAIVHGTIHGPGYSGSGGISAAYTLSGAAFADDFHLFAVEWETNRIRWYVDHQLYFTATPASLPGGAPWVYSQAQFLILNVAVGGNWPGNPGGTTIFPQRMTVDYVRVYAATNVPACGGNGLPNPGFETGGLTPWTIYGAGFNTLLANSNNAPVHGGSNAFKVFGQFSGNNNYSGAFSDVDCPPGTAFTADGWALTPGNDTIAGDNTAWIEVSFRDPSANLLSLYRTALIDSSTPADVWLKLAVTNQLNPVTAAVIGSTNRLVAPAGTAFARCQMVFRQPLAAAGSVLFDDLSLPMAAETIPPVPVSASWTGNSLQLSFSTLLGLNYQVRYKNDLADATWQVLTNVTGGGGTCTLTDEALTTRRFYYVARICN